MEYSAVHKPSDLPLSMEALAALPVDDPVVQQALIVHLITAISAIEAGQTDHALRAIAQLPHDLAKAAYNQLLIARFPDGTGDIRQLDDATVLILLVLLAKASDGHAALAALQSETTVRTAQSFQSAALAARMAISGVNGIASLWPAAKLDAWPDIAAADITIEQTPIAVDAHRARIRHLAENGQLELALNATTTALSLPLPQADKLALADELAVLMPVMLSSGMVEPFDRQRFKRALAANPQVAAVAARLTEEIPGLAECALPDAFALTQEMLRAYAQSIPQFAAPYPERNGKPHVNMLFLEVTNYCNQKCTFCPDMHREIARTWLPVERVKELIDQISETLSLNMLALNAYGEPLLHPDIDQILAHVRSKNMPWPVYFTTHGMTLVDKKLKQLSHNYPTGIAVSMHNDSQASYAATRSAKIGDYDTLVTRVSNLARQMVNEQAPCHMRIYQMVNNGHEDLKVPPEVRAAFPSDASRTIAHVRKWEAIAAEIAAQAPAEAEAQAFVTDLDFIRHAFRDAVDDHGIPMPLIEWTDVNGGRQQLFMSCRPLETYANLLLEYHDDWTVEQRLINPEPCRFLPDPSLTIFANGKLGLCCLDLNNTANFGNISDYPTLVDALNSPEARQMFAELSNGIAVSKGCQICLGEGRAKCGSKAAELFPPPN